MTTTTHAQKKIHLFEDEGYDLRSSSCRRIVYKPISLDSPLFDSAKQPNKILSLNLTKDHFKPGAVKWSDLKPEPLNLVNIWTNSLAFALDKKSRLSVTPQQKKNVNAAQNKRKRVDSNTTAAEHEGGTEQSESMQIEKEEQWIGGREFLTVHVETLFDEEEDGNTNLFKVSGYRLWVFDGSSDKSGLDLLTKGLQECLLESTQAQYLQEQKLQAHEKATGNGGGRKGSMRQVPYLSPEFQFTTIHNDSLFMNLVSSYCIKDDLLSQQTQWDSPPIDIVIDEEEEKKKPVRFIDNRQFLSYNRTDNDRFESRIGRDSNTLHELFDKEQAMIYHVEYAKIRTEQRCMASYCGKNSGEIDCALEQVRESRIDHNRFMDLRIDAYADKEFSQYPFPTTTYRVDAQDLSQDKFFRLPLPHHIGSYLYNTNDREHVEGRIKEATSEISKKPRRNIFGKSSSSAMTIDEPSENYQPLGLHDIEYEITVELLGLYKDFLTEEMKKYLLNGGIGGVVPPDLRNSFMHIINNDVQKELMAIENDIKKKKDYFVEKVNGQIKNKPGPPVPSMKDFSPSNGSNKFTCTTNPFLIRNKDKQHNLDRRVFSEIGGDASAVIKEKNKHLSNANLAYFRSIIGKYRPVDATEENALSCGGGLMYDAVIMSRNIYQILAVLNKFGYANIDRQFFDPRTNKIRKGQYSAYLATKRAFLEAITIEFYEEFRTSKLVSNANVGIRSDIFGGMDGERINPRKRYNGIKMPVTKFNIQARPYHFYKLWVYSYFTEHDAINHHYKTMDILFHARYHHCRSYPPGSKDPKLNSILSGQGTAGKSHRLQAVKDACPTGVSDGITHLSNQAFNVGQNMDDMLIVNEEMSNKLISPAMGKGGTSEAANDDVRNNFKERSTGGMTSSLIFYYDEETGERKAKLHKCSCQSVILGATNNDLSDSDPAVMSRFVVISVPRSKNDVIGNRPLDKNKLEIGKDENKNIAMQEQIREVHRYYYVVECLINSGILGNTLFGVQIDNARTYIDKVLDTLHNKYGIETGDTRKRRHVLELARCMCISYACWFGVTSPTTRDLQYDPYTGEFIGFNPRVLLDGILPYLVVTKDMVINALTSLSCLWGHEYMDKILEHITKNMCNLDKLRPSDFLRRPKSELFGPNSNTTATSAFTTSSTSNTSGKRNNRSARVGVDDVVANGDEMVTDYNYITIASKTYPHLYELLSQSIGELCVAPNDISKILKDLSRNRIQTEGYTAEFDPDDPQKITRLVKSDDESRNIPRAIVDYGMPSNGLHTIAISVSFLKQKLPHILKDSIIEDLTNFSYHNIPENEQVNNAHLTGGSRDDDEEEYADIRKKIMNAIIIKSGSVSETGVIKAIRDVFENEMLEKSPKETEEEEQANFNLYRDVFTGDIPWMTFPTSEHPQPIIINSLFPHLTDKYIKVAGFNKEILLVDKISVIQLQRKKGGIPLVHYNYNTVGPSAQASLSVFNEKVSEDDGGEMEIQRLPDEDEYVERGGEVTKNQFHMYSAHPVFKIDRDMDYVACESHLRNIAYPIKRVKNRLVNFPPHTYMNLVDYRRALDRPMELVPLYDDVLQRIDATRRIIEAQVGMMAEDTPLFADLFTANYEKEDLDREAEEMVVEQSNRVQVERQEFTYRKNEILSARKNTMSANSRYNIGKISDIVSAFNNVSSKRPTKRAKVV